MPFWRACARPEFAPVYVVVGTIVLAATVSAQTQPVPTLPPAEPPEAAPAEPGDQAPQPGAGDAGTGRPAQWAYDVSVGFGYDSNINYRTIEGPSSWAITPRATVSRTYTGERGSFGLRASGHFLGYTQETDLNRYYATAGFTGSHRPSPGTTWHGGASYSFGYSDAAPILTDQGVLLPLVKTHTAVGSLGWSRRLGLRTSMRIDARYYYTHFDRQDAAALRLVDGESLRGTTGLEHGVGLRDSIGFNYSLEGVRSRSTQLAETGERAYYLSHYGSVMWNHVLSPKSGFMVDAGASYTPESAQAGLARRQSFYGGASYSLQARRSSFSASVRREVTPAFGLGVSRVVNRFSLDGNFALGRRWAFHINGTHVLPENPEGVLSTYGPRDDVAAALARRLGRHFDISAEGRYRHREGVGLLPDLDGYQVGIFLSLVGPR